MKTPLSSHPSSARSFSLLLKPAALCAMLLLLLPSCGPDKPADAGGGKDAPAAETPGNASTGPAAPSGNTPAPKAPAAAAAAPAEQLLDHPASPEEAAARLDLSTCETLPIENLSGRSVADLMYQTSGGVKPAYTFHREKLQALKWKELEGASVTDEYASGTFRRDGFHVSVTIFQSAPGKVDVTVINHGNVEWSKLPLPTGLKPTYVGPVSAIYGSDASVAETTEALRKQFQAANWQPYGGTPTSNFYKQNGVQLTATVSAAPAQDGKTVVELSSLQLSIDLPALLDAQNLKFDDNTGLLTYDTPAKADAVDKFYRLALEALGWKATTDQAVKADGRDVTVFRNAAKAMITLRVGPGQGEGSTVKAEYMSPERMAKLESYMEEQRKKLEQPKPPQ